MCFSRRDNGRGCCIGLALEGVSEKDFPKASLPQDIELKSRQFTMLVGFDKLAYEKKCNSRSVKKTLSIPAWLNTLAEEKHLNFSSILQYALKKSCGWNNLAVSRL